MSQKILVIDDTFETRNHIKEKLEGAGYNVILAVDGVDALKVLKNTPQLDLILTDYRMPSLGGEDLLDLLSHHYPNIKKIVVSGYPFIEQKLPQGLPLIPKPIDWERALQLIKKTINS